MSGLMTRRSADLRTATIGLLAGLVGAGAMSLIAGTSLVRAAAALVIVYALGYVTGSLLVDPRDDRATLALGMIRCVAGLLLTTVGFFLSLLLSLPWSTGPVGLFALAVIVHRRAAFVLPRLGRTVGWNGVVAGLVGVVLLAPTVIAAIRMAPGEFPPVFFNVDTPYFLEKVHALAKTSTFPPESLSFVDGRRAYHFGVHGLAALISRGSGMAPHHSLFLIVLPLLTSGALAAAFVLARCISPALPALVAVPMLLISVPTLWYPFWTSVWPRVWGAAPSLAFGRLASLTENYELWGVASNNGQNLGALFLVLASLAGIAAAPSRGWRLPVFLIGSAVIFKTPTGVALAAGFSLAQAYRAVAARSLRPLMPAVAVAAVFGAVYSAFWILPAVPQEYTVEIFPLFYFKNLSHRDAVLGFVLDAAWLVLPAVIVLPARLDDQKGRSLPLLFFAVAPFLVVNLLRSVNVRPGSAGDEDWLQTMLPVPLLLRAFVLSVVGQRWARLSTGFRVAFLCVIVLSVLPPVFVAARYSRVLILDPRSAEEFVDNRPLAEALAAIPTEHTIIVTNDLRYPADGFRRDNRQMQIPALFGHQAFAVNYAYEFYSFSRQREELQRLLRAEKWSPAIDQAARTYHWTHLLVRKDYAHPDSIPLELVFENALYSVFRFGTT